MPGTIHAYNVLEKLVDVVMALHHETTVAVIKSDGLAHSPAPLGFSETLQRAVSLCDFSGLGPENGDID